MKAADLENLLAAVSVNVVRSPEAKSSNGGRSEIGTPLVRALRRLLQVRYSVAAFVMVRSSNDHCSVWHDHFLWRRHLPCVMLAHILVDLIGFALARAQT